MKLVFRRAPCNEITGGVHVQESEQNLAGLKFSGTHLISMPTKCRNTIPGQKRKFSAMTCGGFAVTSVSTSARQLSNPCHLCRTTLKETRKAELKGAGLVHGENWAARCEPAEISAWQPVACQSLRFISCRHSVWKAVRQSIHIRFLVCCLLHLKFECFDRVWVYHFYIK